MNIKKKLFNLVKAKHFVSFIFVIVLILGFSFLNVNKSFACYDDDGFYYDCNQTYECNDPEYPVRIGDQCYAVQNNNTCSGSDCGSSNTDVPTYTPTQNCNGETISAYDYCPPQTGGTGSSGTGSSGTNNNSSNWSWGVGLSWNTGVKCWNGSTVNYQWQCPTQYTGCTSNCNTPTPITCDAALGLYNVNGICQKRCTDTTGSYFYISPSLQCPTTSTCLNGQVINNVCSKQCPDGSWKPVTDSCPTPPPSYVCWDRTIVQYASQCPVQPIQYPCWNGQVYYQAGQCPPQITTFTCWNGVVVNYASQCPAQVQYQTCWNGQKILSSQQCPPQYQTCWNSQTILVTQQCPVKPVICDNCNGPVIQNHSAVTNMATQVAQTSAQCNGVGLIANKVNSVGWFEYGETTTLGKNTNSGNIGSAASSPFSNLITGLKVNTTYYCRAVIANLNGTYKGQILSFKTLQAPVVTKINPKPQPVVYPGKGGDKGGSTTTKVVKKSKTEFVCSDGSLATAKTVSVADTVNAGGKLMQVNIDKDVADLAQGSIINYKLTIKNTADTALTGTEVRFVLPSELSFDKNDLKNATIQNNIIIISETEFNAGEMKTYTIPVKVSTDAAVGKTVVTTGYVSYYLPVVGAKLVKDEVSAYMIANISDKSDNLRDVNKNAGAVLVGGTFVGAVFPQTLLSWLIFFAVILIIVVLIMNIHSWIVMRKKEKEEHVIHHHIA